MPDQIVADGWLELRFMDKTERLKICTPTEECGEECVGKLFFSVQEDGDSNEHIACLHKD